jgi:predicted O-methyltransferase YrrM
MIKSTIKRVVPKFVFTLRDLGRARREDELTQRAAQQINPDLMRNAKLVPDRVELLTYLPKNAVVAEIGVAQGMFSENILRICQPTKLHLIDPWDSPVNARHSETAMQGVQARFADAIASKTVELHRGYSFKVLATLGENVFDWVYLDAAHDYTNVRNDLELLHRAVKPGGIIAGHDYIRWVSATDRYGVLEAVNEFINRTKSELLYLTNQVDKHDTFAFRLNK